MQRLEWKDSFSFAEIIHVYKFGVLAIQALKSMKRC